MKQTPKVTIFIFYMSMALTGYALYLGWTSWLLVSLATHIFLANIFTVTFHRYYCHKSFRANDNLMFGLSCLLIPYFYASAVSFTASHTAHHALSDTEADTHLRGWKAVFGNNHKEPPVKYMRVAIKYMQINKYRWYHENHVSVAIIIWVLTFIFFPNIFLYVLAVPTFTMLLVGRLHTNFSHYKGAPCNRWYLEYILPYGGEWSHDYHHLQQTSPVFGKKWFHLDTGSLLIKLIKND